MVTLYLKVPASWHTGYRVKLTSTKAFTIERDKEKKILSAVQITESKELITGPKVVDKTENTTEEKYPEIELQAVQVGTLQDGSKIVYAIYPFEENLKEATACTKALDTKLKSVDLEKNLNLLGLSDHFIGYNLKDVTQAYPELIGDTVHTEVIEGKETEIRVPKITPTKWSGE